MNELSKILPFLAKYIVGDIHRETGVNAGTLRRVIKGTSENVIALEYLIKYLNELPKSYRIGESEILLREYVKGLKVRQRERIKKDKKK